MCIRDRCIPFLENDDSNRALMGANMQRQAVPLIDPKAPYVGTGMEYQAAHDSGAAVIAQHGGKVTYADADKVEVRREDGSLDVYHVQKFRRSNSGTAYNQRTLVKVGETVEKDVYKRQLSDSFSGNMMAKLTRGVKSSVSRKYVKSLMDYLGV